MATTNLIPNLCKPRIFFPSKSLCDCPDQRLPDYILVTVPPKKTVYTDGELIDTTGMIVTAFYSDGSVYGNVTGYTINPTVAIAGDEYTDGHGVNAIRVKYIVHVLGTWTAAFSEKILGSYNGYPCSVGNAGGTGTATLLLTRYNGFVYANRISGSDAQFCLWALEETGWRVVGGSTYRTTANQFTESVWEQYLTLLPTSTSDPRNAGEMHPTQNNEINVNWMREDGVILSTSFNITVNG